MDDTSIVKIMQSLGLDYSSAILSTKHFEQAIQSLNQQLTGMKSIAMQSAKEINRAFADQLGQVAGSKTIVDQFGKPLVTVQAEAKKATSSLSSMANNAKSATSAAASSMNTATVAAKNHGQAVQDVAKQYNVFGNEMQRRAGWFLSGSIWYGGIKAAKEAITTISEVEMGMTEIARVMEDSSFVFENYRDKLLQMGVDYGQTFETVQDIALRWAQAGYNVADSLELTKTSLLALNTAELNAANATESMVGIMAQWGLEAEDLLLVIDKINKTADDYTVTSQDLVDGLLRSSSAAKIMNLSIDETISLLTVMREASGRTGREVGNALNSILSYIQRPGSISVLESMGIKVFADEAKTEFRNVMGIFQDVAAKWNTASDSIKDGFVTAADDAGLFNEELATALGLQEQWNDLQQRDIAQASAGVYRRNYFIGMIKRLSTAQKVLNNMTDAAGYSQTENARTMDTLEKKYISLKTAAQQLAVALGDAGLLDILKGLTDMATNLTSSLSKINPEMKALLTTALELLAVTQGIKAVGNLFGVNATLGGVMAVLPGWTKLIPLLIAAAGAIGLYAHNAKEANNESLINSSKTIAAQLQEANNVDKLIARYETLREKVNLTEGEQQDLRAIVNELAQIYPHLTSAIDDTSGALDYQIGAIKRLNETQKQSLMAQTRINIAQSKAELQKYGEDIQAISDLVTDSIEYANRLDEIKNFGKLAVDNPFDNRPKLPTPSEFYEQHKGLLDQVTNKKQFENFTREMLDEVIIEYSDKAKELLQKRAELEANMDLLKKLQSGEFDIDMPEAPENKSGGSGGNRGAENYLGNLDKYVLNLDRYMSLNAVLDDINIALEKNQALESAFEGTDRISYIKQENELLKQKQQALHALNEERRKELEEIKAYLTGQGIQIDASNNLLNADDILRSKTVAYNSMPGGSDQEKEARKKAKDELDTLQDKIKSFVSLVHKEIPAASIEWFELATAIEKNNAEINGLIDTEQKKKEKAEEELKQKIEKLQKEWTDYYKDQLKEQQKAFKDAYDERIRTIEDEAKIQKKAHEDRIKQIDDELEAIDRSEEDRDYANKMKDLQEELAYWSVRTGEEARKKRADLQKQIDEEEHDREVDLKKRDLEDEKETLKDKIDAIEEAAKIEKEKWEATYKDIEAAFDSHVIDIISTAGAMAEGAYDQWVEKYFNPLMESLTSGTAAGTSVRALLGQKSLANAEIYQLASSIVDFKRQYEQEGNTFAHQQAKLYYEKLSNISPSVAETLHTLNYMQAKEYLKGLPQMHSGGRTLSYGAVYMEPGEIVFPADLSIKMDALLAFLKAIPAQSMQTSTVNNRREVTFNGPLMNIEKNYNEDEADSEILAKQLQRAVRALI